MQNPNRFPNFLPSVRCLVTNDRGDILLVQRSGASGNNGGQWEIPGGKLECDEDRLFAEDPMQAAARETEEEAGVVPEGVSEPIFIEGHDICDGPHTGEQSLTFACRATSYRGTAVVSDAESSDILWCPADKLPENLTHVSRLAIQRLSDPDLVQ